MDGDLSKRLLERVTALAQRVTDRLGRRLMFMEVCGTHTTVISRSGLRGLLAPQMELRSGPGCPVCVTDQRDIDRIIALAGTPNVVVATFGDMVRVPGTTSSLEKERARGAAVEIFYSPREAVVYAQIHPDREIVFLGVGFETTIPTIAMSIAEAVTRTVRNYSVLSIHKVVPPAMRALLSEPGLHIDGFILPGHVCTITGRKAFDFVASQYGLPAAIAGFEPLDVLEGIYLLLEQMACGCAETANGYIRLVREDGNLKAKETIETYFEPVDADWRGFGTIPGSGLAIRSRFSDYDGAVRFPVEVPHSPLPEGCACGEILKGRLKPDECPLFGTVCTTSDPVGPCMVSSEGACAACYQYGSGY
jgi:hydrogenase expression/formation protein HypD